MVGNVRIKARMVDEDWLVEGLECGMRRWPSLGWAVGSQ